MLHKNESELAGKTVIINDSANEIGGHEIFIEDWWDRVSGVSWMNSEGNPACMIYAMRTGFSKKIQVPIDDDVVYGKINGLGYLVHVSELNIN